MVRRALGALLGLAMWLGVIAAADVILINWFAFPDCGRGGECFLIGPGELP